MESFGARSSSATPCMQPAALLGLVPPGVAAVAQERWWPTTSSRSTSARATASRRSIIHSTPKARAIAATPDGPRVFVSGDFTTVDGAARGHIAAFDTASGALVANFTPNIGGTVRALTANNTRVYAGGAFTAASGQTRVRLASFATSNGALQSWNPSADDNTVWSMVLTPDNSKVVVGGAFTTINGAAAYGMGAVDSISGASMPWATTDKIRNATNSGAITSLRTDGEQIYGTGYAYGGPTNFEGEFAADPTTGAVNWLNDCHGDTYDVFPWATFCTASATSTTAPGLGSSLGVAAPVEVCNCYHDVSHRGERGTRQLWLKPQWHARGAPAALVSNDVSGQLHGTVPSWLVSHRQQRLPRHRRRVSARNGTNQQGLVRFARPGLAPNRRAVENADLVPVANSVSANSARVTWTAQWDMDNEILRYDVFRDGGTTPIGSVTGKSDFTNRPTMVFVDRGVVAGASHTYRVRVVDPFNNAWTSPSSAPVTISGTARSDYANLILDRWSGELLATRGNLRFRGRGPDGCAPCHGSVGRHQKRGRRDHRGPGPSGDIQRYLDRLRVDHR